ncbi:alpha/beta fold hydrolase [Nocardia yamanashiensis]|uniref:alpha/beta fold hydrolase n=1 Tax=Nocardia yamanashiensis TaxID=209247 RepID=UPI000A05DC5E|nr:alpha/beta hydrolase [Nocardia yamanashiensis]
MTSIPPSMITLPDRPVGVAEYGSITGEPVMFCHGLPGSHVEAAAFDEAAAAADMRIIAIDRPGIGASPLARRERVADWSGTVAAVADQLGLDRFAVLGVSGGGPYALACAHGLPARVTATVLVSAPAPFDHEAAASGESARQRGIGLRLMHRFPFLARPVAARMSTLVRKPSGLAALIAQMAPVDRTRLEDPALAAELEANLTQAFASGSRGVAVDTLLLFARPWGFDLADITVPVHIWHGDADNNVPVADGRQLAAALPNHTLNIVAGAGHLMFVDHAAAILNSIRAGETRG